MWQMQSKEQLQGLWNSTEGLQHVGILTLLQELDIECQESTLSFQWRFTVPSHILEKYTICSWPAIHISSRSDSSTLLNLWRLKLTTLSLRIFFFFPRGQELKQFWLIEQSNISWHLQIVYSSLRVYSYWKYHVYFMLWNTDWSQLPWQNRYLTYLMTDLLL